MRSGNSSFDETRIPFSICFVILLKKLSIMFSQDASSVISGGRPERSSLKRARMFFRLISKEASLRGPLFEPFSATLQSIRRIYPAQVLISILVWDILYSTYVKFISYPFFLFAFLEKSKKSSQSVLFVMLILCYTVL